MRRTKIDALQVEELALIGCTISEISMHLNCSEASLDRRFHKNIKRGMARCMILMRRQLFVRAINGDATALKWFLQESVSEQVKDLERRQKKFFQSLSLDELQGLVDFIGSHTDSPSTTDEPEASGEPASCRGSPSSK